MATDKWLLVQTSPGPDPGANFREIEGLVGDGAGAGFVAVPELSTCRLPPAETQQQATSLFDKSDDFFRELALSTGACVLGSMPQPIDDRKFANVVRVYSPQGDVLADYAKINLFDVDLASDGVVSKESEFVQAGTKVTTFEHNGMTVGLAICFDLRFPAVFHALRRRGAQVIVVPSAFTAATGPAHWEPLLRARAIETQCYVLAPNQCGRAAGVFPTHGHSLAIDPWGTVIGEAGDKPTVLAIDVDRELIRTVRQEMPMSFGAPA